MINECMTRAQDLQRQLADARTLLEGYVDLVQRLEKRNDELRHENGKLRLLADLKADIVRLQ